MAFQNFDVTTNPANGAPRVAKLRTKMAELGLDGFLVPRADEHQGEYVPPHAQRLAWLTGFTGSAGAALILKNSAYVFVDGRYELQVRAQTDPKVFSYESLVTNSPASWLEENSKGLNIGFDPWLHTISEARALREALENQGVNWFQSRSTLSTPFGTTSPACLRRKSRSSQPVSQAMRRRTKSGKCRRPLPQAGPARLSSPIRPRSRGCSIFAARTFPTRRFRSAALQSFPRKASQSFY